MKNKSLGVGIIGGSVRNGWAKQTHIPAIQQLPGFELAAVCTSNWESAEESAHEFQATHGFVDAEELANHADIDLVVVSVKVRDHFEAIEAAVSAGKAIYCEWPLGIHTEQAIALQKMAAAKKIPTAIGLQARQAPAIQYMKDLIESGFIGQPISGHLKINSKQMGNTALKRDAYLFDRDEGGSLLSIAGGHALDTLTYIMGDFKELSAKTSIHYPTATLTDTNETIEKTTEDQILVSGKLESDAVVHVHIQAGIHHLEGSRLEIYGEKGTLVLTSPIRIQRGPYTLLGAHSDEDELNVLTIPDSYYSIPDQLKNENGPVVNVAEAHQKFAQDIDEGTSQVPTFEDAVKVHQLLDTIVQAAQTGERQYI